MNYLHRLLHCRNVRFIAAVMSLLPLFTFHASAETSVTAGEWVLQKDKSGIQLFTSAVAGSPFEAVRASVVIEASIDKVTEVFGDGEGCPSWREMCKVSKILKKESEEEQVIYMVLDLPWPISDRDMVMRSSSQVNEESQTATFQFTSASSEYPEQDYVRAQSTGMYSFKVLEPGRVELVYEVHVDLGGDLSPGMINSRLADSTYDDIKNLLKLAES